MKTLVSGHLAQDHDWCARADYSSFSSSLVVDVSSDSIFSRSATQIDKTGITLAGLEEAMKDLYVGRVTIFIIPRGNSRDFFFEIAPCN